MRFSVASAVLVSLVLATSVVAGQDEKGEGGKPTERDKVVAQALAEAGHEKLKGKEYEAAEQLLRQALEKHPDITEAVYDLARVLHSLEKFGEATELYHRYRKLTEGEGKTQQRVMAGIYLKKLDREYGEMQELRQQVIRCIRKLLKDHSEDLTARQKVACRSLLTAFGVDSQERSDEGTKGQPGRTENDDNTLGEEPSERLEKIKERFAGKYLMSHEVTVEGKKRWEVLGYVRINRDLTFRYLARGRTFNWAPTQKGSIDMFFNSGRLRIVGVFQRQPLTYKCAFVDKQSGKVTRRILQKVE
jgi:tetratricopeptide (TPR) repeat protein